MIPPFKISHEIGMQALSNDLPALMAKLKADRERRKRRYLLIAEIALFAGAAILFCILLFK